MSSGIIKNPLLASVIKAAGTDFDMPLYVRSFAVINPSAATWDALIVDIRGNVVFEVDETMTSAYYFDGWMDGIDVSAITVTGCDVAINLR